MCIFATDFNGEITKRYARSVDRNVGTFYLIVQNLCDGSRI